jgi:hypothetical protein
MTLNALFKGRDGDALFPGDLFDGCFVANRLRAILTVPRKTGAPVLQIGALFESISLATQAAFAPVDQKPQRIRRLSPTPYFFLSHLATWCPYSSLAQLSW